MRKVFITTAMLCSLICFAEDVSGIVINKSDGNSITVAISDLQNIKFSGENMIVNMKDESQHIITIDDITNMIFGDATTAIKAVIGNSAEENIVITDLSGRVVYNGVAKDSASLNGLRGIYVITAKGKSHKVKIGG